MTMQHETCKNTHGVSCNTEKDFECDVERFFLHCMLRATKGSDVYRALNELRTNFYRKWELAKEKAVEISEREAPPDILTTRTISRFEGAIDIMPTCSTIAKELRQSLAGVAKKLIKTFNPADVRHRKMSLFWEECICNAKGHKYPGHEEYVKAQELAKKKVKRRKPKKAKLDESTSTVALSHTAPRKGEEKEKRAEGEEEQETQDGPRGGLEMVPYLRSGV